MASDSSTKSSLPDNPVKSNANGLSSLLTSALGTTAKKFISSISIAVFKENLPDVHKADPDGMRDIYKQFIKILETRIQLDLENLILQNSYVSLLDHLDKMKAENRRTTHDCPAWRPSGKPEEDIRAHRIAVKLEEKTVLEATLKRLEADEERLRNESTQKRTQLKNLEEQVTEFEAHLDKIVESCDKFQTGDVDDFMDENLAL